MFIKNEKIWRASAAILLIVSVFFCFYLAYHHYSLLYGMQSSKSFCSINTKFDCDAVNISKYSEVYGIPIALLGAFGFLVELIFLLGSIVLDNEEKAKATRMFFYLNSIFVAACVILGLISALILKTYCFYCITLYVLCFATFFCGWKLKETPSFKFSNIVKDLKSWVTVILLLLIPAGSVFANMVLLDNISSNLGPMIENSISNWEQNKKFDFVTTGEPSIGPDSAALKILVFSDFQCPHCKHAAPSLHAFANAHKDQVQLVYQNYPLDSECNDKMQSHMHPESCFFAKVAICANQQDKYAETHDWIFERQDNLSHDMLSDLIKDLKLSESSIKTCMDSSEATNQLQRQVARANMANVEATPSIFANGRLLPNGFLIPILERALNETLDGKTP